MSECRVLDIFAGSGCVGIAVLKNTTNVLCDISDRDPSAIAQIKINCRLNKISPKRFRIIKSDVFTNIKGKYDYILANPPYIATTEKHRLGPSVLQYEPKIALFGGKDGLFYIRKFLWQAKKHLRRPASAKASARRSKIYMEFHPPQKKEISKILKRAGYSQWDFFKDQYGRYRWVVVN